MQKLQFKSVVEADNKQLIDYEVIKGIPFLTIIEKYKELGSMKDTGTFFNINPFTLRKYFSKHRIPTIGRGYASQGYTMNPFEDASKEDKGYWVGFIAGDGYIEPVKNRIAIVSKDLDIIEKFKNFTNGAANVYQREIKTGTIYEAKLSNKDAKDYLAKFGIVPKKSLILTLSVKMDWNVFRGLFDADGSLSGGRPKITTGSPYVIVKLENFLNEEGFKTSVTKKGNAFDVYILSDQKPKKDMLRELRSKMYPKNVNYYLDRKRQQMDALCSDT